MFNGRGVKHCRTGLQLDFWLLGDLDRIVLGYFCFLIFAGSLLVLIVLFNLFVSLGNEVADRAIFLFKETQDLNFHLLETFSLTLLQLSFSSLKISGLNHVVDLLLLGSHWRRRLANLAKVKGSRVFIGAGRTYPGHHAHLFLLLLLLLLLLDLLNHLLLYQLVDVPPVHQQETVTSVHLDVKGRTQDLPLVLLNYLT